MYALNVPLTPGCQKDPCMSEGNIITGGGCQAVMLAGKSGKSPHNPGYLGDANSTLPLPLGEGWGEGHTRRHCGKRHFQVLNHGPGHPDTLTPALSQGERDLQCRFPRLPCDLPCDLYRNLD